MSIVLAILLLLNVLTLAALGVFFYRSRSIYRDVLAFITPEKEGEPSPLAEVTSRVADNVADAVLLKAKATIMAGQKQQAWAEKEIDGAIAQDAVSSALPAVGALMGSMPQLSKFVKKHPELIQLALDRFGSVAPAGNGHNKVAPVKFKL